MNVFRLERDNPDGTTETLVTQNLNDDKFAALVTSAPVPKASVNCIINRSLPGGVRLSFMVQLHCDQTEAKLNEAGLLAFDKATEFSTDGTNILAPGVT